MLVAAANNCGIVEVAKGKSNDAAQALHEIPLPGRRSSPLIRCGTTPVRNLVIHDVLYSTAKADQIKIQLLKVLGAKQLLNASAITQKVLNICLLAAMGSFKAMPRQLSRSALLACLRNEH